MKLLGAAAFAAGIVCASGAWASSASAGYITNFAINSSGAASFQHSGGRGSRPACHTQASNVWVFNAHTAQGQAKLSILLTAYALKKPVVIYGSGACAEWGDTESADVVFVIDQ